MVERRSLSEGIKPPAPPADPRREAEFMNAAKSNTQAAPPAPANVHARVPISTRMRAEYAEALKRASLERQLNKVEPNSVQDILEAALEPWLRQNGYIR